MLNGSVALTLGISMEDFVACSNLANEIYANKGDVGTCCLGMGLFANGKKLVDQSCQGCTTNYAIFDGIEKYLSEKYPNIEFRVEHGVMD